MAHAELRLEKGWWYQEPIQPPTQFQAGALPGFLALGQEKGGLQASETKRILGARNLGFWVLPCIVLCTDLPFPRPVFPSVSWTISKGSLDTHG